MTKTKLIFLPPPITSRYIEYQDVNADIKLRKNVTDYYFDLIQELINNDKRFKKFKNKYKLLSSKEGYKIIYKILRRYTRKYSINWYDLRKQNEYTIDYLYKKITTVLHI